ncbi:hypothetical protein GM672_12565 [Massilia buxea]|uniref:Uncharacterized protein n=1 Tax=Pseudoduganella buxea TaxID=1949069 RepID=A0A6I3SWF4_9BURK|nr:hypothetical protein [Pseudoduganella buxea]
MLDMGAVRFGLAATDAGEWAALTDGAPLTAGGPVRPFGLNSWGKDVQCFERRCHPVAVNCLTGI